MCLARGSLRQEQVCDALRCSGLHACYTDTFSESKSVTEQRGANSIFWPPPPKNNKTTQQHPKTPKNTKTQKTKKKLKKQKNEKKTTQKTPKTSFLFFLGMGMRYGGVMARHGGRHGASWRVMAASWRASWRVMAVACVLEIEFFDISCKIPRKPSKATKITKKLEFPAISFKNGQNERKQNKNEENISCSTRRALRPSQKKNGQTRFSRHFGSRSRLKSQSAEVPMSGRSGQMASVVG